MDHRISFLKFILLLIVQFSGAISGNCAFLSFTIGENVDASVDIPEALTGPYSQSFLCLIESIATVLFVITYLTVTQKPADQISTCVPVFTVLKTDLILKANDF